MSKLHLFLAAYSVGGVAFAFCQADAGGSVIEVVAVILLTAIPLKILTAFDTLLTPPESHRPTPTPTPTWLPRRTAP